MSGKLAVNSAVFVWTQVDPRLKINRMINFSCMQMFSSAFVLLKTKAVKSIFIPSEKPGPVNLA